jgi:hypothetical protein
VGVHNAQLLAAQVGGQAQDWPRVQQAAQLEVRDGHSVRAQLILQCREIAQTKVRDARIHATSAQAAGK